MTKHFVKLGVVEDHYGKTNMYANMTDLQPCWPGYLVLGECLEKIKYFYFNVLKREILWIFFSKKIGSLCSVNAWMILVCSPVFHLSQEYNFYFMTTTVSNL